MAQAYTHVIESVDQALMGLIYAKIDSYWRSTWRTTLIVINMP